MNLRQENTENRQAIFILWIAGIFLFVLRPIEAYDTFWQLQSGRHIWQAGEFIRADTFSLAAQVPRVEHCWLSDLIFYGLYLFGGYPLLSLLKPLTIVLCGGLLWLWNHRRGVEAFILLPVLILCLVASMPSWLVRPQLWTFVFSLLYIHLLFRGRSESVRAWLWLPVIMVPWANLHAACVFGFALIGFFALAELVRILRKEANWPSLAKLSLVGAATVAASFVNPYGYRIPLIFLGNLNLHDVELSTMVGNMEWLPPTFEQIPLFYVVMVLWGVTLLARFKRLDPAEPIFFAAFLYMGLSMVRHTTLAVLLAGYFLPLGVQESIGVLSRPLFFSKGLRWALLSSGMALLFGLIFWDGTRGELGWGLKEKEYPVAATEFLREHRLPGQLYNAYDWGGYLMWRLYPDYLVFVDGRSASLEHFEASNVIDNAWPGWQEMLDQYGIKTVISRTCYYDTGGPVPLVEALGRDARWALVYRDEVGVIFLRRALVDRHQVSVLPSAAVYETMRAEAIRLYDEDRFRDRALLARGRAEANLGRLEAALTSYQDFLARNPDSREALTMLAILGRKLGL